VANKLTYAVKIIVVALMIASCNTGVKQEKSIHQVKAAEKVIPALQQILDSNHVSGCILVYDPADSVFYSNDFERCRTGHLPASTFKIPNSIIALETGVVEGDSTVIKWDGQKRRLPVWEQDLYFRDAFRVSCVPCYQEIARKIGVQRMKEYLSELNYGNMVVDSATIDLFWLEGESRISPFQQVDFLCRFYNSKLPVSARTDSIMKRILIIEENDTFHLSGKTGWSVRNGNNNGWFVGYVEKGKKVFYIATNIDPEADFNMDMFAVIRQDISMKAFKVLGIL
jgi:beta-lactamase class D